MADILIMLEGYTVDHFQHEEALMAEYGYPDLDEHREKHRELIESLEEIKGQADSEPETLAQELFKFLRVWLLEHIVAVDKKYGKFLVARGGRFIS